MIEASRRGFLTGLIALAVTAPAIVRAASIMPVRVPLVEPTWDEIVSTTLRNRMPELQRNLLQNNALLRRLHYAADGQYKFYSGYDLLLNG